VCIYVECLYTLLQARLAVCVASVYAFWWLLFSTTEALNVLLEYLPCSRQFMDGLLNERPWFSVDRLELRKTVLYCVLQCAQSHDQFLHMDCSIEPVTMDLGLCLYIPLRPFLFLVCSRLFLCICAVFTVNF